MKNIRLVLPGFLISTHVSARVILLRCVLFVLAVFYSGFQGMAQTGSDYYPRYVNPFIDTAKSNVPTRWGNAGGTYPGAVAPSGIIQFSPETSIKGARGYNYADSSIYYFTCFGHMSGFPEGSTGRLRVMPVQSNKLRPDYNRKFSHTSEIARPGYYKVIFTDDHTIVEATATARAGIFRFTFASGVIPQIFIADAGEIISRSASEIHAENRNAVMLFSEACIQKKQVTGGWLFIFAKGVKAKKILSISIATSTISHKGARLNIRRELSNYGFDAICKQTDLAWQKKLAAINVIDSSLQNKTVFYTALYHSLLLPWVIDDADGRYKGADGNLHHRSGAGQYGAFSPWDTFRTLHPLLALVYPDQQNDIILSMLDFYRQSGRLPVESMTGNHSIPIIVDSYLKGITAFDKALAFKAMKRSLIDGPFSQKDMPVYQTTGYVPFTNAESVTRTVEYAYDDWALAQFAREIAGEDSTYRLLAKRSYSYRRLFNKDDMLFLPRNKDVFKLQPGMSGYKEGDKWIYGYFVPHNIKDLINLSGGNENFTARLDSVLQNGVILFDNETVFHVPYLFNQSGAPQLTQKWCRQIMLERYSNSPGGLPGNDDLGSMSSWYVFSAMGLYPVCPGKPLYSIGSPLFKSVVLNLQNQKKLIIRSHQKGDYIRSLNVNGAPWQQLTVSHALLLKGAEIIFSMNKTATDWPTDKDPVALSETKSSPSIKIRNFSLSKAKVSPDDVFYARFELANEGGRGLQKVIVYENGQPYAYKNCLAEEHEVLKDSISIRLYETGRHNLYIDQLNAQQVTVDKGRADPETAYRITAFHLKAMIGLQEIQQVDYTIQNTGGSTYTFKVPVTRNDTLIVMDTITLGAGKKKSFQHRFYPSAPGFQQIAISNEKAGYKVYSSNDDALLLQLAPVTHSPDNIIRDMSGFGHNGRITGSGRIKSGKLLFDEDTHIEVTNATGLDEMGETITIMGWVFATGNEKGLVDIITKGDSHVLQVTGQKKITFFAGGWGRGDCTADLPLNWKNNWHHVAGVCSGKKLELFIDGKLTGSVVLDEAADLSNTNRWFLGQNEEFPGERVFHGRLNLVKIFKTALTTAEIEAVFNREQKEIYREK
jgi:putative alpha-1,2-mannosidase